MNFNELLSHLAKRGAGSLREVLLACIGSPYHQLTYLLIRGSMQINSSPRFIKNFTLGLVASSLGAFIVLPGTAMPEAGESTAVNEVMEETAVESIEDLPTPSETEALPSPESELEAEATVEDEATDAVAEETAETEVAESIGEDIEEGIEALGEDIEEGIEALDEDIEEGVEALDEDVEEGVEAADEDLEEGAEALDEDVEDLEADAEMTDETVEADAEMTDETVEADAGEEIDTEALTIAELTDGNESFTILAAALEAAELTSVLSEEGPFTVFAPTDEAFEALPEGVIEQLLMPENKNVLIQILTYHVVPGAVLSSDLETGSIATVEGSDIAVGTGESVTVNDATVLEADVLASNGVIHVIDQVIAPLAPEADADVDSTEAVQ